MHLIDWLIMTLPLLICGCIAVYTRRYVRSVADFMAGGRAAGRFLICTARSEQGSGAAVFVSTFQVFMVSGFTLGWWNHLYTPLSLLLMVSGFVIYRYRQTRAMTLGQFFEMRYSRRFRLFAGMLGLAAGLINFGVIPAIGANFMVAFLGWPQALDLARAWPLSTFDCSPMIVPTYLLLMALFLTLCVIMTTTAGQVSVLLVDCAEGMFSQLFYTAIAIALLVMVFDWANTKMILLAAPPTKSMVNPFDTSGHHHFNFLYVLIGMFTGTYRSIAWQNSHAFNSSAATPHEARMGGVLGRWRNFAVSVMTTLLAVCAFSYFKAHATEINAVLNTVEDPSARSQMESPLALTMMLPVGVKGMLLSICLMGIIAGDGIHLHSWGSIFIQDVVAPLRLNASRRQTRVMFGVFAAVWNVIGVLYYLFVGRNWLANHHPGIEGSLGFMAAAVAAWQVLGLLMFWPFSRLIGSNRPLKPSQHIMLLRLAIAGVAMWAFLFGWLVPQIKYVQYWWGITEAIFVSGAGVAIIGGLYWSRGTTAGAWVALLAGSTLAFVGIGTQFYMDRVLKQDLILPVLGVLNVPMICFIVMLTAITSYTIVSLMSGGKRHNMDKLLHRGAYAVEPESEVDAAARTGAAAVKKKELEMKRPGLLYRIVTFGIDEQFSRSDRWITISITLWSMLWFTVFCVGTVWNSWRTICGWFGLQGTAIDCISPWSPEVWADFWLVTSIYMPLAIGAVTTIWFTIGCTHDMIVFFRRLREEKIDVHDDGSVSHPATEELEKQPVGQH